jgi:WhiB family redox-sensing transcriptional regulator
VAGTPGIGTEAVHREGWLDAGACRNEDPELFFPITSSGPSAAQLDRAKEVCQRCCVQDQCLHYALESHQNHGVWGGTSEQERVRMAPAGRGSTERPAEPCSGERPAEPRSAERPGDRPAERPAGRPANARRPARRLRSGREGRSAQFRA